jgi:hypothetical protein
MRPDLFVSAERGKVMTNDEDAIRRRAYELWELDGRPDGRHDDHWRRARLELATPKLLTEAKPEKARASRSAKPSKPARPPSAKPSVRVAKDV